MNDRKTLEYFCHICDVFYEIFGVVKECLKERKLVQISRENLDQEVYKCLEYEKKCITKVAKSRNITTIDFVRPESSREAYDILFQGSFEGKSFEVLVNNKFGNLSSNTKNDITTYNNLLGLYLGISESRFRKDTEIREDVVEKRRKGEEIISYGVFVFDNGNDGYNFFLLEEVDEKEIYVNPRNTMVQVSYKPEKKKEPNTYLEFVKIIVKKTLESLEKAKTSIEEEICFLQSVLFRLEQLSKS